MDFDDTPDEAAWRERVRAYITEHRDELGRHGDRSRRNGDSSKARAAEACLFDGGLVGVTWPKEHGGQGYAATEQLIFFEEANIAGAPLPFVTISTVGPALMAYGSAGQKAKFLPSIAAGETIFAIGYSEPNAGSDLASLTTQARVEPDRFIVNGNKLWTSGVEAADYVWLAARTSTELARHKGISLLIVDTRARGFSHTLIPTVGNATAATYYDDVEVPADMLVGELHGGWKLMTAQLNHERLGLGSWADKVAGQFARVLQWAKARDEHGQRAVDQPWVRRALAACYAQIEAMRLINFRIAAELEAGALDVALASITKVYGSESGITILRALTEVVGAASLVRSGSAAEALLGELEYEVRAATLMTFGGGTNELQRELIAQFGLKMPRPVR